MTVDTIREALPTVFALLAMALAFILVFIYVYRASPEKRKEIINEVLFALAVEAERLYGSQTGQLKKKQVIAWFYERYKWLSVLIQREQLAEWIDTVVDEMNEWLKSNPIGAANVIK